MTSTSPLTHLHVVEAARESMRGRSFMSELFAGEPDFSLLEPPPRNQSAEDEVDALCERLRMFLEQHVDPEEIERSGEIPQSVIHGLAEIGCLGLNIPREYGGLGFSQAAYNRVLTLVASYCNILALVLSVHQSIGVSKPLLLFGNEAQKRAWLPRLAKGALTAFALTEPQVGSDPASMTTTATLSEDGAHFTIEGEKLWCTNGGRAEVLILMAKVDGAVTAFIVERSTPGIEILQRNEFMGCRGIDNVWMRLSGVRVPAQNVIGQVGKGLRVALTCLNTGRVSIAALCLGMAKLLWAPTVWWAGERETFGRKIGRHELNAQKLARMAADLFAMEALCWSAAAIVDGKESDFRVEAAAAKLFCSERLWDICDAAMQLRGGRAYEKADSLRRRGEVPVPVEQIMRDARLYLIGEGASEVLTLFIAREVWDPHLRRAGSFLKASGGEWVSEGARLAKHYALWYARRWRSWRDAAPAIAGLVPRKKEDPLQDQLDYVERTSRRLARVGLYAMARYGARLEEKQALIGRLALIGVDLYAITAAALYAQYLLAQPSLEKDRLNGATGTVRQDRVRQVWHLVEQVASDARVRIEANFRAAAHNSDEEMTALGNAVLDGAYDWIANDVMPGSWTLGKKPLRQVA
jgi:alkylation response protein AidB-like acyl-CoA dehydrogenase